MCFLGGGDAGDIGRECLRGGESEWSRLDLDDGGDGDRYLERVDGGEDDGDLRFLELEGDLRFDLGGEDFLLWGDRDLCDLRGLRLLDLFQRNNILIQYCIIIFRLINYKF